MKAVSLQGGRAAGRARVDKCYTVSYSCLKPALVTELQNGSQRAGCGIEVMKMPVGPEGAVQGKKPCQQILCNQMT